MRLATVTVDGNRRIGRVTDDGFVDLTGTGGHQTLRGAIAAGQLENLSRADEGRPATFGNGEFEFDLPIPDPEKIICVGVNYPDRNAEYRDGQAPPPYPSLFVRVPRSLTSHGRPLIRPPESHMLDYEGEVAVVIGRGGRRIPQSDAAQHVAAATLCNDGTLRDWVRHAKFNVTQGKNWERSGAMGPWLVPVSRASQLDDIRLTTRVNGELRQDDRTSRMVFPIPRLIAYVSTFTALVPGDIIVTGTPTGAGARLEPPRFLKPGDVVEVEAEGIGTLVNTVEDEP